MFPDLPANLAALGFGYLLGSIPFGLVLTKLFGEVDPRTIGSQNIGATNVLRTGNRKAAILTLVGDAAKGAVAVLLAKAVAARYGFGDPTLACVGLAAFVGHLFPVFHRFQGGKGVATAAGVLIALSPWLGLATLATWITIAVFFRYSSLAALVAAVFAPAYYALLAGVDAVLVPLAIMSVLLILRHRRNISNLIAGTESRIGQKKTAA